MRNGDKGVLGGFNQPQRIPAMTDLRMEGLEVEKTHARSDLNWENTNELMGGRQILICCGAMLMDQINVKWLDSDGGTLTIRRQ